MHSMQDCYLASGEHNFSSGEMIFKGSFKNIAPIYLDLVRGLGKLKF